MNATDQLAETDRWLRYSDLYRKGTRDFLGNFTLFRGTLMSLSEKVYYRTKAKWVILFLTSRMNYVSIRTRISIASEIETYLGLYALFLPQKNLKCEISYY